MRDRPVGEPHGGYDPVHFTNLLAAEDRHFWFRARNELIGRVTSKALRTLPARPRVLEVGCGNGNVLRRLETTATEGLVVGMDLFGEGLRFARQRTNCALVQGDMRMSPFGKPFHLIGMYDVLEHIQDDSAALEHIRAGLVPDGLLMLTVPANPALWSAFDTASGHCRRYTLSGLRQKLEHAGFTIELLTPFMASLYPLIS